MLERYRPKIVRNDALRRSSLMNSGWSWKATLDVHQNRAIGNKRQVVNKNPTRPPRTLLSWCITSRAGGKSDDAGSESRHFELMFTVGLFDRICTKANSVNFPCLSPLSQQAVLHYHTSNTDLGTTILSSVLSSSPASLASGPIPATG